MRRIVKPEAAAAVAAPELNCDHGRDQLVRPAPRVLGSGKDLFFFSFTYKQACVPYKHATVAAWAEVIH